MPPSVTDALRRAVSIWLVKPQVANRRLFGSKILFGSVDAVCHSPPDQPASLKRLLLPRSPQLSSAEEEVEWIPELGLWRFRVVCSEHSHVAEYEVVQGESDEDDAVSVRLLRLELKSEAGDWIFSEEWFTDDLLDRLNHWYEQSVSANCGPVVAPMRLVDVESYMVIHRRIKERYSRSLIASWTERTNAEKFVYEDVAIAAYLIALWSGEENSGRPIRFVDLGCGNGLLVYLLNAEGYQGIGLDVRRRRIWDQFPASVVDGRLLEVSLDPSDPNSTSQHLPKNTTWLLGNHSDELTPWLPVLAARHSPDCNFFVLPCCPHDLFSKFSQPGHRSRYRAYLDFVGELGRLCGFGRVAEDVMRIPSTRRICWVGWAPGGDEATLAEVVEGGRRRARLDSFKPRAGVEPVRNCTQLPVGLRERVCDRVFSELLNCGSMKRRKLEEGQKEWNHGGRLTLGEVSALVDREDLKALKAQHGGLQTLLRNHHQAFVVADGGVTIRRHPRLGIEEAKAAGRLNTSRCWMEEHHPDGCPRSAAECPFQHEEERQDVGP